MESQGVSTNWSWTPPWSSQTVTYKKERKRYLQPTVRISIFPLFSHFPIRGLDPDEWLYFDYRRSPRNRSSSPYGRTRSPHRYNNQRNSGSNPSGGYEPKRIRSPVKRDRSRSRSPLRICRLEGMDTKGGSAIVPASSADQTSRNDSAGAPSKSSLIVKPFAYTCLLGCRSCGLLSFVFNIVEFSG